MVPDRIHPQTPGAMLHPGAGGAGTLAFPLSPGSVACDGGSLVKEGEEFIKPSGGAALRL